MMIREEKRLSGKTVIALCAVITGLITACGGGGSSSNAVPDSNSTNGSNTGTASIAQNAQAQTPGPVASQQHYDAVTSRFVPPAGYTEVVRYRFGTNPGNNIQNLTDLSSAFVPYLGTGGGLYANASERARYRRHFETDLHVFTENSLRLYLRTGASQKLDGNGDIAQPDMPYAQDQWMRGAAIRAKEKFHKNAIFVVRARLPAVVPGIFPAAWIIGGYRTWPPELDIFESWTTGDTNHPEFQTDDGKNNGNMVYDNNWVVYQTAHRFWRNNNLGQRGHVIGKTDNDGNWVDLDAYEDENRQWQTRAGVPGDLGGTHYTTTQVRVQGMHFPTTWVDFATGLLDDPKSNDPSKGIATWWLGASKSRASHYWLNTDRRTKGYDWGETDTVSLQINMTAKDNTGSPDHFPQWLEIQEISVYEPDQHAVPRQATGPRNDARIASAPRHVRDGDQVTVTVQWRNVEPDHTIKVYWADFWDKTATDTGSLWAGKKLTEFKPATASGQQDLTFTLSRPMLENGGDTNLAFDDPRKQHGFITLVTDNAKSRAKRSLGIDGGEFAKSLLVQDGVFYGVSSENLIEPFEQY